MSVSTRNCPCVWLRPLRVLKIITTARIACIVSLLMQRFARLPVILDDLYVHDNAAMGLCALTALEAVNLLGAAIPDVELLRARMVKLGIKPSD